MLSIFNLSLTLSIVPSSFKRSTIVPVLKKPRPSGVNDYCPVALTSVVMKCFEKLVRDFITSSQPASMDSLQFAYHHNRSTDDAIAHLLHTTLTHLDNGRDHNQYGWATVSSTLTFSTGGPQGCVLSPLLYSLYTYDCTATSSSTIIVKFADDLITDNNERAYLEEIKHLENWCQKKNLLLNVSKTKELIVDCSKKLLHLHYREHPHGEHHSLVWEKHQAGQTSTPKGGAFSRAHHSYQVTKARRIVKDPTHPNNRPFSLL
ncbi:hypothetical protein P4O66_014145, partial [Electrophorus voltai]